MQGALSIVYACLILGAIKTDASQVLSAPLYLANYASSYNSHVVSHDVRYPVATAPLLAPAVAVQTPLLANQLVASRFTSPLVPSAISAPLNLPVVPQTPLVASRFASPLVPSAISAPLNLPVVPQTPLVASRLAPVSQLVPSAPVAPVGPVAPQLPAAPIVEAGVRSAAQKNVSPNPPAPEQLSRSTQANSEPAPPKANPVPNSLLAASQFLARQFSQQQQSNSEEAPQAKPRFLVAGNPPPQSGEKFNGDDSESVEVNSAESLETPAAPNAPKLPPPAEAPRARIVFSPVSVLRSPVVPSPYAQLISF